MPSSGQTTNLARHPYSQKQRALITDPVANEVKRKLTESPYAAIRQLEWSFHEGVVILRGDVPTYYTRQVAQVLVKTVAGVEQIDDRITVGRRSLTTVELKQGMEKNDV